ncbi:MAG: NfeD family protein [Deltaproteobacteria bacterium]|nr:NfeD family protein [Deltaproteobacteria bacterium]
MKPEKGKIPHSVYPRYILMNLPGVAAFIAVLLIVGHWVVLPGWLFWVLVACWIAKEAVLFPFVWRAYEPNDASLTGALVGEYGIVKKRLAPSGYVQVRGELWRAERLDPGPPLEVDRLVRIEKMTGLTLYVVPDEGKGNQ